MPAMKALATVSVMLVAVTLLAFTSAAQAPPPPAGPDKSDTPQLEMLIKKVDEENAKIDALSQQLMKLELQVSAIRPGVMIGEPTPAPAAPTASGAISDPVKPSVSPSGNSHVIAKGETLTSIAKMYKVGVEDLQKFNHIENDRKLQVGQTIMIPTGATAPSPTPSAPAPTP